MPSQTVTPLRVVAVLAALVVAGAVAVGVGSLMGDDSDQRLGAIPAPPPSSPSPSPSPPEVAAGPSPEPTTPEELKAKNIAEAKARLVEYYATTAEVANAGYVDWEAKLSKFWGHPDIARSLEASYMQFADSGARTTGAAKIEAVTVTGYTADDVEHFEEVALDICVDFSDVQTFDSTGNAVPRDASAPTRYKLDYVMRHQGVGGVWTVNDEVRHPEQPC